MQPTKAEVIKYKTINVKNIINQRKYNGQLL